LSGFGVSLNVDRARLIARDGFLEPDSEKVTYELQPRNARYDSIVIDGHSGMISLDAIKWAMRHGIPIFMLDYNGTILSSTLPREPMSSGLKIAQVKAYESPGSRLHIARKLIEAKIQRTKGIIEWLSQRYDVAGRVNNQIDTDNSACTQNQKCGSSTVGCYYEP
jgi:CRISPR-associated protein Cas1